MSKQLKSLKGIIEQFSVAGEASQSDIVKIIIDIRQILEKEHLKEKYQQLNFFCNWVLHVELSGSSICYKMLEKMTDALLIGFEIDKISNSRLSPTEYFTNKAQNFLALDVLRKEFIDFFKIKGLPIYLFNDKKNWQGFANALIHELSEKPIKFPANIEKQVSSTKPRNKTAVRIFKRLMSKANGNERHVVRELSIISDSKGFKGFYCWQVQTIPQMLLRGKLQGLEPDIAFDVT
jgi:hypothetical protein